jgi:hypothetical protein
MKLFTFVLNALLQDLESHSESEVVSCLNSSLCGVPHDLRSFIYQPLVGWWLSPAETDLIVFYKNNPSIRVFPLVRMSGVLVTRPSYSTWYLDSSQRFQLE